MKIEMDRLTQRLDHMVPDPVKRADKSEIETYLKSLSQEEQRIRRRIRRK